MTNKNSIYHGYHTNTNFRPFCSVPGCDNLATNMSSKKGFYRWRRSKWIKELHPEAEDIWCCSKCHNDNTARKHGVKSATHLTAQRHGLSVTQYSHRNHPYLWARKDYCENIDGRLGFTCTYTGPNEKERLQMGFDDDFRCWLQVDHIDGNSDNNPEDGSNFQTLCACCHSIKTIQNKDYASIGRKKLKQLKNKKTLLTTIKI